jgi:hypothetical protein
MSASKTTANGVVANHSVPEIQPPTKTSLGRLTYNFDSLPKLLVVQSETKSNGEHCKIQRLRNKAIREFMKQDSDFKSFEKHFAVRFWATKLDANSKVASVDHLILQVKDGTNLHSLKSREFTTRNTKLHVRESSDITQYAVTLSIKVNGNPIGEDHESYWANLDFLLRTYVSGDNPRSEYGIDRDFLVGNTVVNRPENFADLTKSWFPVFVRNQPKIENKKFVLDFDVLAPRTTALRLVVLPGSMIKPSSMINSPSHSLFCSGQHPNREFIIYLFMLDYGVAIRASDF